MKRLLAAVDEDPLADQVVDMAGHLAQRLGASVVVCHVMPEEVYHEIEEEQIRDRVEHPLSLTEAEEQANEVAQKVAQRLSAFKVRFETRGRVGKPAETIVSLAQELDVDMIVLGFEGLRGLGRLRALGSVSRAVLEQTRRPVVVVPALQPES